MRTTKYFDDDYQLRIGFDSALTASNYDVGKMNGAAKKSDDYYIAELSFPFKTVTPHENMEMGFDVLANASKMIGFARTLYTWNVKSGSPQIDTSTHGTLILRKNVSIKDFDEPVYEPVSYTHLWVFDNTCYNGFGNQSYTVTNLHINKGDMIYHEVDCGTNNTGAAIYWKPIITYTYMEPDAEKPDPTVTPTIEPTATPEATATPERCV